MNVQPNAPAAAAGLLQDAGQAAAPAPSWLDIIDATGELWGVQALSKASVSSRQAWLDSQQHFSPLLSVQLRGAALESVRHGVAEQRARLALRSLDRALGVPRELLDRLSGALSGSPTEVTDSLQRLTQSLQLGDRDTLLLALRSTTYRSSVVGHLESLSWVWVTCAADYAAVALQLCLDACRDLQ